MFDFSVLLLVAVYQARIVECSVGETHTYIHSLRVSFRGWKPLLPFLRGRRLSAETLRLLIAFTWIHPLSLPFLHTRSM